MICRRECKSPSDRVEGKTSPTVHRPHPACMHSHLPGPEPCWRRCSQCNQPNTSRPEVWWCGFAHSLQIPHPRWKRIRAANLSSCRWNTWCFSSTPLRHFWCRCCCFIALLLNGWVISILTVTSAALASVGPWTLRQKKFCLPHDQCSSNWAVLCQYSWFESDTQASVTVLLYHLCSADASADAVVSVPLALSLARPCVATAKVWRMSVMELWKLGRVAGSYVLYCM